MERRLRQCMVKAHDRPIPDVTKTGKSKRRGNKNRKSRKNSKSEKKNPESRSAGEDDIKEKGVSLQMDDIKLSLDKIAGEDSIGKSFSFRGN